MKLVHPYRVTTEKVREFRTYEEIDQLCDLCKEQIRWKRNECNIGNPAWEEEYDMEGCEYFTVKEHWDEHIHFRYVRGIDDET